MSHDQANSHDQVGGHGQVDGHDHMGVPGDTTGYAPPLVPEPPAVTRAWWRRPRWIIGGIAAVVLIVVAVLVVPPLFAKSPEDVVTDYLTALREGDLDTATGYSDHLDLGGADAGLLSEEAIAEDWNIARLARSHPEDDDPATVDVTIEASDGRTSQGRFELSEGPDGWTILNPLVKVNLSLLPVGYAEFNGVAVEADLAWLFPGAYSVYESDADLFKTGATSYVAVPSGIGASEEYPENAFLPLFTIDDALNDVANAQVRAWIDRCADSTDPSPQGCPFAAGNSADGWNPELRVGNEWYVLDEVTWEVAEYPVVRLEQGEAGFAVQVVTPGEMAISGTDVDDVDFSGSCGIGLTTGFDSAMVVRPGLDGEWPLEATPSYTCSSNRYPH